MKPRRNPPQEYVLLVNRVENNDLYSWQGIGFATDDEPDAMYQLPPDASPGDMTAVVLPEYVSDLIPHLELLSMVGDDEELHPAPFLDNFKPYGENYLQVFENDQLSSTLLWNFYQHFTPTQTAWLALSLADLCQSAHKDSAVDAALNTVKSYLKGSEDLRRIQAADSVISRFAVSEVYANEIKNVKRSFSLLVHSILRIVINPEEAADEMVHTIGMVNQCMRDISLETGSYMFYGEADKIIHDHMKPFFSFQVAWLSRLT